MMAVLAFSTTVLVAVSGCCGTSLIQAPHNQKPMQFEVEVNRSSKSSHPSDEREYGRSDWPRQFPDGRPAPNASMNVTPGADRAYARSAAANVSNASSAMNGTVSKSMRTWPRDDISFLANSTLHIAAQREPEMLPLSREGLQEAVDEAQVELKRKFAREEPSALPIARVLMVCVMLVTLCFIAADGNEKLEEKQPRPVVEKPATRCPEDARLQAVIERCQLGTYRQRHRQQLASAASSNEGTQLLPEAEGSSERQAASAEQLADRV
eukprot:gnl/TRDRNA2_/TRDRNA2_61170_c0_seq1.p1 gnl/TRDRNA2_/TRDRNA2_61170_c0~~gnl/TRDRNA2_/TRDRNA2_61170_c0_seq1.p1  ORF type:complete len:267 (-),score=41.06 gnl/TRDRNA2_/TRDRNA2_61170_c0_seq1:64-864(-)